MSYLDKLLAGRPVTWKPLGEVAERMKGTRITAEEMSTLNKPDGPVKIFGGGKTVAYVDYGDIPVKDIHHSPSVIVKSRGNIDFDFCDQPFSHKGEFWSYCSPSTDLNIKFVYYYLKSKVFYFRHKGGEMQMPQIGSSATDLFPIPIPPRDVQEEIVRVLDRFTELEAELEARQKQYAYYRDLLLTFPDDAVTYLPLGDVVDIRRGKRVVRKDLAEEGSYAVFQNSLTPLGYFDKWNVPKDSCFVVAAGAAGEIGYSRENFWAADDIYYFESSGNLIDRYLYHFLLSSKHMITSKVRKASIPRLSRIALERLPIPIPPLEEQERIVGILDRFETLAHSITEGLPRDLELRRMQYSYYRDLLLTFTPQD